MGAMWYIRHSWRLSWRLSLTFVLIMNCCIKIKKARLFGYECYIYNVNGAPKLLFGFGSFCLLFLLILLLR